jgi:hypothetical protein
MVRKQYFSLRKTAFRLRSSVTILVHSLYVRKSQDIRTISKPDWQQERGSFRVCPDSRQPCTIKELGELKIGLGFNEKPTQVKGSSPWLLASGRFLR